MSPWQSLISTTAPPSAGRRTCPRGCRGRSSRSRCRRRGAVGGQAVDRRVDALVGDQLVDRERPVGAADRVEGGDAGVLDAVHRVEPAGRDHLVAPGAGHDQRHDGVAGGCSPSVLPAVGAHAGHRRPRQQARRRRRGRRPAGCGYPADGGEAAAQVDGVVRWRRRRAPGCWRWGGSSRPARRWGCRSRDPVAGLPVGLVKSPPT